MFYLISPLYIFLVFVLVYSHHFITERNTHLLYANSVESDQTPPSALLAYVLLWKLGFNGVKIF